MTKYTTPFDTNTVLLNPITKSNVIYEGSNASDIGTGTANLVRFIQLNSDDCNVLGGDGKTDYSATYTHLVDLLGVDVVNNLIVTAAMDSTCQNNALNDVLKVADEKG
jgi:hypothetical protein